MNDMKANSPSFDPAEFSQRITSESIRISHAIAPGSLDRLRSMKLEVESAELTPMTRATLRFTLVSCMINVADDLADAEGLFTGEEWASQALQDAEIPRQLLSQFALHLANAQSAIFQLAEKASGATDGSSPAFRLGNLEGLREARFLYSMIGADLSSHGDVRSRALCNLANSLDESGRWVEAYSSYSDALEQDPTNGNAAGNLAELLRRRLNTGKDQRGHIAAVYDSYVKRAQSLRDRTVEIAGEAVAQRWDQLQLTGSAGHLSHDGDELDEYHQWIIAHRLALVAAVEGLGSDGERWDSASLVGYLPVGPDTSVSPIFAAMNVLKAEYLTARRLAFRGQSMLEESPVLQHPDDTGSYTDTMDGAIYGESAASLLLAQRSALDVLDKIAVTANEYFQSGMPASKVTFQNFWIDAKSGAARPELNDEIEPHRSRLALAELASDMDEHAMYSEAKLLRNAGTHRLVHGTWAIPTGPTKATFSTVDMDELSTATIQALSVTRAAYLYLIDLVQSRLIDEIEGDENVMKLPLQE
ncbi:LA2681 family HEPN domain-containing protein [Cryobacterium sp. 5I3]|uniref:LA2681 family HEPN domain-containing protein n=1 Tax=Cryobacterium sp. 5I3 TaxID=3048592 RepID=UPI002B238397|nr:LA2681 family HEPN domain-containing protein [Cryobacterium sp. 5I3]MEB0201970.1 LA2681 family HEPN domain-containing protein [Cryobacterium sp. 5I3]